MPRLGSASPRRGWKHGLSEAPSRHSTLRSCSCRRLTRLVVSLLRPILHRSTGELHECLLERGSYWGELVQREYGLSRPPSDLLTGHAGDFELASAMAHDRYALPHEQPPKLLGLGGSDAHRVRRGTRDELPGRLVPDEAPSADDDQMVGGERHL